VLVVVMLAAVVGSKAFEPSGWRKDFKVGLGLDLNGGTTLTLKAVTAKPGQVPSQAAMNIAASIMLARVNGLGTSGAEVQKQSNDLINVSVPGKSSQAVVNQVGTTALLRFRQVLLEAPGIPEPATTPVPTPSPSTSPSTSPSPSSSAAASPKASPSPKKKSGANGSGQALSARSLGRSAAGQAKPKPTASASASPKPSSSAASPSPSPSATPAVKTVLATTATAQGDASLVSKPVAALFDKLNCKTNWQQRIYHGDASAWDAVNSQIVACDSSGNKYVLDVAKVTGTMLTSATAGLDSTNQDVVNFTLNGTGTTAFADLTSSMYSKYFSTSTHQQTSVLDDFAIVLDGKVISAPFVQQPITTGSGTISGSFTQAQVTSLANVLKYGHLPLTFKLLQTVSVSPQLGAAQLDAGLIAAAVGLLLVVIYSFLYYRGLGVVSVSSLAIAALLTYLSVVLLTKYENFTLSLAGIAGLIVAIGITADSFVVFFERLRDEVREGKSLRAAVERGWQRARRTILVSDTVSFLAAALLYFFAIGDVKGFAYTLGLTTLIDVVVVFLFTKPMITLLARTKFYGQGHKLSGLDPARLGARAPWRGAKRTPARPATGGATATSAARTTPKEA
jgi:preprotein translocase subunit SecD